jgi:hypothetical protein
MNGQLVWSSLICAPRGKHEEVFDDAFSGILTTGGAKAIFLDHLDCAPLGSLSKASMMPSGAP